MEEPAGENEVVSKMTHPEADYKDKHKPTAAQGADSRARKHHLLRSHWGHAGFSYNPAFRGSQRTISACCLVSTLLSLAAYSLESAWLYLGFFRFNEDVAVSVIFRVSESSPPLSHGEGNSSGYPAESSQLQSVRGQMWNQGCLSLSQCFNSMPCRAAPERCGKAEALTFGTSIRHCSQGGRSSKKHSTQDALASSTEISHR